jgi:hypothetical protein
VLVFNRGFDARGLRPIVAPRVEPIERLPHSQLPRLNSRKRPLPVQVMCNRPAKEQDKL